MCKTMMGPLSTQAWHAAGADFMELYSAESVMMQLQVVHSKVRHWRTQKDIPRDIYLALPFIQVTFIIFYLYFRQFDRPKPP
jgi:hypothetical protein